MERSGKFISILVLLLVVTIHWQCSAELTNVEKGSISSGLSSGVTIVTSFSKMGDPKASKFFDSLGKMSNFLGAAGGLVSFVLAFLPSKDSAELAYMKQQFTLVNTKLDKITTELDNIKMLIKLENQRAAYLSSSHAILQGYRQLTRFFDEIQKTKCQPSTCKRIRARIASRFVNSFNVKHHLDKILHGTIKATSVFGEPLLDLVSTTYKCDFSKINWFANGVLKLAFTGQQVVLAYEKLMGTKLSITQSMNDWLTNVYQLRSYSYKVKNKCFQNIQVQIRNDVGNSDYQVGSANNDVANSKVKKFLETKYPWMKVIPFSYSAYGSNEHCTTDVYGGLWNMPKDKNARKRVLVIGMSDKMGSFVRQKYDVMNALDSIVASVNFVNERSDYCKMLTKLRTELNKKNVWKFIASLNLRKNVGGLRILASNDLTYISQEYKFKWWRSSGKRKQRKTVTTHVVIVLKSLEQANGGRCTLACKNSGQCKVFPYSSSQYCQCIPFYGGNLCEEHSKAELAKTIDSMLAVSLKLPVLSDIAFDIKDLRQFVGTSFVNMQKSISNLESTMQKKFNELSKSINDQFKWANFITMYKDAIQTIEYYAHRFERLPKENPDKKSLEQNGKKLATAVLDANIGIRKALYQLNNLIGGKVNKPVLRHKPILLAFMESRAGEPCTPSYKKAIDNYWRQLLLLQQLGYMVWAQALEFAGKKPGIVNNVYKTRVQSQVAAIKKGTCQYDIPNSANVHCNKQYLHPGMTVNNKCRPNYYVTGSVKTSCTNRRSSCSACQCFPYGSRSMQCTDLNGRCSCKAGFYGHYCENRNCIWGSWSRWGHCLTCGYSATKRRTRGIRVQPFGCGQRCQGPTVSSTSCFTGCCRNQYHCSNRRKCIHASLRCNYDNNCGDKQDERGCNEHCYYRYTGWSSHGGGKMVYLDRHHPYCGYGSAMKMFHLQRSGGSARYQYICCNLLKSHICYNQRKYNGFTSGRHHSSTNELRHQLVSCGPTSYISSFNLRRNGGHDKIRYEYNCCHLRNPSHRARTTCYAGYTNWSSDGKGKNFYLDRQTVICHNRYFLNGFQLHWRKGSWWKEGSWRYWYRCCKINI